MLVVGGGVVVGAAVCSGADSTGCAHVSSKRTVPYRLKVTASYMQGEAPDTSRTSYPSSGSTPCKGSLITGVCI